MSFETHLDLLHCIGGWYLIELLLWLLMLLIQMLCFTDWVTGVGAWIYCWGFRQLLWSFHWILLNWCAFMTNSDEITFHCLIRENDGVRLLALLCLLFALFFGLRWGVGLSCSIIVTLQMELNWFKGQLKLEHH